MINKAKQHLITTIEKAGPSYGYLLRHLSQAEKWAKRLIEKYPEADGEIVLLGVWLHDIGQVVGSKEIDHAVNSEAEARRFLTDQSYDKEKIKKVLHCVRAHRCKDVLPETLEAKILAAADSASHMTDTAYIEMTSKVGIEEVMAKLERDFRDVELLPGLKEEVTPLYVAWKKLLEVFPV